MSIHIFEKTLLPWTNIYFSFFYGFETNP